MRARNLQLLQLLLLLLAAGTRADDNVTVVRKTLSLEQEHTLMVDSSVEYILQFVPSPEQNEFPMRVWFQSEERAGDETRPVLITARQRAGASTWQLPHRARTGAALQHELTRTLCPDPDAPAPNSLCDGPEESSRRGEFSVHVASWCSAPAALRLRAAPARDWSLELERPANVTAALSSPHVSKFEFPEKAGSVRLVVSSPDDVCATIAVHPLTCPIAQSLEELPPAAVRMTVLRSGAAQLSRSRFGRGFYVVALVEESDTVCTGEEGQAAGEGADWLWEAALGGADQHAAARQADRAKQLTYEIKASLSRAEYVAGVATTLAVFLSFYVGFGALVLAARWPACYRLVRPLAVLQAPESETGAAGELVGGPTPVSRRTRRGSTATFDSSDDSDTDSEEEATNVTAVTAASTTAVVEAPPAVSPAIGDTSPGSADVTTPEPHVTAPGTDITVPGADVTAPGADVTVPDADVTVPDADVTVPGADVTVPGADFTSPGPASPGAALRSSDPVSPDAGAAALGPASSANGHVPTVEILNEGDGTTRTEELGAGAARPFGLPARLRVAALARRRARVLHARSQRYLYTLYTVAVFYALPVVQFVAAFQLILNVSGSLDLCYYNFLCAHPLGALSDFNHVFSNLGYLLLGALYMLQVRRRRARRRRHPRDERYGIPPHYGLATSLGASMMVVAVLSASYHVCPNRLNFQFDTAFMYVLAVLSMVKIYQSRHPDINARAHSTFAVLALLIALVVWGVLGGGPLFWSVFSVLHVFTFLLLSLRIYYVGQFRLEKESLAEAARSLSTRPLYTARLVALLLANAVNWAFAIYGLVYQDADIASHLLFVLLCNCLLYVVFYLSMKLLHGERVRWYVWVQLGGAAAAWTPALYYFMSGSSDWSAAPASSRLLNHECRALAFYDAHDLWHMLSAVALYLTFNVLLCWDDGLAAVPRTHIAVF